MEDFKKKWLFYLFFTLVLIFFLLCCFLEKPKYIINSIILFEAAILISLFIDKIKKVKIPGAEIETLQKTIEEANLTINKFREFMKPFIIYSLYNITYSGRSKSKCANNKDDVMKNKLMEIVESLSLSNDKDIQEMNNEYIMLTKYDLICDISGCFIYNSTCNSEAHRQIYYDISNKIDAGKRMLLSVEELNKIIGDNHTNESKKALDRYAYYLKHNRIIED